MGEAGRVELLSKLKRLSECGVGGEASNAEKILLKLMKKCGITESDLDDEAKSLEVFKYRGQVEDRILTQVIYMVMGDVETYSWATKPKAHQTLIYCTKSEKLEIEASFKFYMHHLNSDINILVDAFIQKNNIFPPNEKVKARERSEKAKEDSERIFRALMMAKALEKHERYKELEEGN